VLVNPVGGKGEALQIWKKVAPIFEQGGLRVKLLVTDHQNHGLEFARDTGREDMLENEKGLLVVVGGDGMLHEVVCGITERTDSVDLLEKMSFGIIPGGSGNGLAKSVLHANNLDMDPINAAFIIAKMHASPRRLDTATYTTCDGASHPSFLSFEYGTIADVDIGSERFRCIGSARFTVEGICRIFAPRRYRGRLSYLKEDVEAGQSPLPPLSEPIPENESWVTVEQDWCLIWPMNVQWAAGDARVAPDASFDDGKLTIVAVPKIGRLKMAELMLSWEDASHSKMKDVEFIKTSAFRLEPVYPDTGVLAVDGEVVPFGPIQAQVNAGMLRLVS